MRRLGLIAGREFKAYVATLTFWVALALGPLLTLGAYGLVSRAQPAPEPLSIALAAADPELRTAAEGALGEAARAMGRPLRLDSAAAARLRVERIPGGRRATFAGPPLPAAAQAVFATDLERRLALELAARAGAPAAALAQGLEVTQIETPAGPADAEGLVRFGLVFILWLTLAGSLGMLLQAVARERANRALDILLSAARPAEIVFGKLLGVGAVSLLVLASWMGSAVAFALASGASAGPMAPVLTALADPGLLAQTLAAYLLAYATYGSVTIALGAAAGDVASAQNLSRPMFGVLLVAFFVALSAAMGAAGSLAWTIWLPPLTPFMWLLQGPGALPASHNVALIAVMIATASATGVLSGGCLKTTGNGRLQVISARKAGIVSEAQS